DPRTSVFYYLFLCCTYHEPLLLHGMQTSRVTPSFSHTTIDSVARWRSGTALYLSTSVAGAEGYLRTIEPTLEAKHFRRGFARSHVAGIRVLGRYITSYGVAAVPPFERYFSGGEDEIRGFESWSIGPVGYVPSSTSIKVLNNDGSPRRQPIIVDGVPGFVDV